MQLSRDDVSAATSFIKLYPKITVKGKRKATFGWLTGEWAMISNGKFRSIPKEGYSSQADTVCEGAIPSLLRQTYPHP
jgi:hypothetical protein